MNAKEACTHKRAEGVDCDVCFLKWAYPAGVEVGCNCIVYTSRRLEIPTDSTGRAIHESYCPQSQRKVLYHNPEDAGAGCPMEGGRDLLGG